MVTKLTPTLDKDKRIFEKHLPPRLSDAEVKSNYGGGMVAHAARVNDVKRLKGGKIGVQGKGVIAIREDHGFDRFRDVHAPLQRERSLPSGFGFVTGSIGNPAATYEPSAYTWNDARRVVYKGNEVWDHSRDHGDPKPLGGSQFTVSEQIEGSRAILEANELVPVGWQMPGVTGAVTPGWSSHQMDTIDKLGNTEVGRRIMATYGLIEADRSGAKRILPTDGCYLLSHVTIDTMTLPAAKAWVDRAVPGIGIEFMYHPQWLGTAGYMTIADFTAFLDYIVQKRDTGKVEVLTPSGLAFADPTTTYRLNWLKDSSFEGVAKTATTIGAWNIPTDAGISLLTDGGTDGTNYVRFEGTANYLTQAYNDILSANFYGGAFELVAKVRNPHATLTGRAGMQTYISSPGGYPDFGTDNSMMWTLPPASGWKTVRMPFVVPRLGAAPTEEITTRIRSVYGVGFEAPVDFDEVKIQPI
jgi:hypothetical protein